ncbi:MAG: NAD-dependent succinate-semialdehyde dehydrogenase [Calditrichia bacterium]
MSIESMNPATGEVWKKYDEFSPGDTETIISKTEAAFHTWKKTEFAERTAKMNRAGDILMERQEELSMLMSREMGKPIRQSRSEIEKCSWVCRYYAENAEQFLADEVIESDASRSLVAFEPLGPVLAVMPWNFPFWQVFRFAAPALMAGNAGLLKHASNVPGCALAIEEIFREAGFPPDIFRTLLIGSKQVESVIENPAIRAATLTGSTPAGRAVAATAGKSLKKSVLELGGSDPYLILRDADLEQAVKICIQSRLINSGQSCIAAKRFIVEEIIADSFTDAFVEEMKSKKMGDPMQEDTDVGPQARPDLRDDLQRQVQGSIEKGARCIIGGKIPRGKGAYYPPTVLTNVTSGMPAFDEEVFGPVAAIISVRNEEEAVDTANLSLFGLGSAVFTQDLKKGEGVARQLQAGNCFINTFVKSDPRLPFGGVKESGYGRELSHYGIKEFVNIKTIYRA